MCPGHLVEKWQREIKRLYPGATAKIIGNMQDLFDVESIIRDKNRHYPLFLIISKDTAKVTYTTRPNVGYDKKAKQFVCPDCGNYLLLPLPPSKINAQGGVYNSIINSKVTCRYPNEYIWKSFLAPTKDNAFCVTSIREKDIKKYRLKCLKDTNKYKHVDPKNYRYSYKICTCGSNLWTVSSSNDNSPWKKYPGVGYIHDDMIEDIKHEYENIISNSTNNYSKETVSFIKKLYTSITNAEELGNRKIAPRRYSIARYIRQRFKGLIDYFIADEVHMYSSSTSAQANAFGDFVKISKKTLSLTGTLLNGYSDSIYHILFRMYPKSFREEGYKYNSSQAFVKNFGVEKTIVKTDSRTRKESTSKKTCPGVSPKLFTKFLLDKAIFVSLADMSSGLPKYTETPVEVHMTPNVKQRYNDVLTSLRNYMSGEGMDSEQRAEAAKNRYTVAFNAAKKLVIYPDQPYCMSPIFDPSDFKRTLIDFPDAIDANLQKIYCSPKDEKVLEITRSKIEKGENVLIYVDYVNKTDCIKRLEAMFKVAKIKSCTLTASIPAKDRERWIDDKVKSGCRVMICNPRLVETGLDLLSFTNIIFYQVGYNLFTMRQASRRSLRLNQPNNVNVYFLYFKDTVQEMVLSLMANKLQAAMAIEGKFSEEGLTAMSNNDSLLTKIATSLIEDIECKIKDGDFTSSLQAEEDDGSRFKMVYILDKEDINKKYNLYDSSKCQKIKFSAKKLMAV